MFPLGSLRCNSLNLMFNFLDHPCIYFKFEFNGSQDFLKAFELLIEALFLRSSEKKRKTENRNTEKGFSLNFFIIVAAFSTA